MRKMLEEKMFCPHNYLKDMASLINENNQEWSVEGVEGNNKWMDEGKKGRKKER